LRGRHCRGPGPEGGLLYCPEATSPCGPHGVSGVPSQGGASPGMEKPSPEIPNRSVFKGLEVCQIAGVQPYVLRTWEAEFPDLGVPKTEGGSRLYRRADLERVLAIKHLLFVEGLTLAGARRKLGKQPPATPAEGPTVAELLGREARERLQVVRDGLRELLRALSRPGDAAPPFDLRSPPAGRATASARKRRTGKPRGGGRRSAPLGARRQKS